MKQLEEYIHPCKQGRVMVFNPTLLEQKDDDIDNRWSNDEKHVMTKDS